MSSLKIFPVYFNGAKAPIYRNECFEPIFAGAFSACSCDGMLRDDTGDNISGKNSHWAELTAHYWVLKNWLGEHRQEKYLGFCHYRRFPDFWKRRPSKYLKHIGFESFAEAFADKYREERILPVVEGYDIVIPVKSRMSRRFQSVRDQFQNNHSAPDLDKLCDIVRAHYPEMSQDMDSYLAGRDSHEWLNFMMRRDWFEEYLNWEVDILQMLENEMDWNGPGYDTYGTIRTPAFLAERFFNVFLRHKIRTAGARVLIRQCLFLVPDEELRFSAQIRRYMSFALNCLRG